MLALRNHPDLSLAQFGTRDSHICTLFQTVKLRSASRADVARGNIDFEKIPLGGPRGSRPSKIPYENRLGENRLGENHRSIFFELFKLFFCLFLPDSDRRVCFCPRWRLRFGRSHTGGSFVPQTARKFRGVSFLLKAPRRTLCCNPIPDRMFHLLHVPFSIPPASSF